LKQHNIGWLKSGKAYSRQKKSKYNDRSFIASYGLHPEIVEEIWQKLDGSVEDRKHLLRTLAFLKNYNTVEVLATEFFTTAKMMGKWILFVLDKLYDCLDEIDPDDRFDQKDLPCPDVFMAIDATVCVIQRSIEDGRKYYAGGQT